MDINISGHHIEITDSLRAAVEEKLGHLNKYDHQITNIDIILTVEKERQKASATVNVPHHTFHAEEETDDMYKSIDKLENTLKNVISQYNKKLDDQRRHAQSDKRLES